MLDDRNRACSCREGGLALQARARPLGGALQGALPDRVALAPHRQSRAVHHDEHVLEPAAGLAHQIRQRTLLLTEGEHAGRTRVDAELVLDREAAHVVARAERAVGVHEHLGHDEQRDAPDAGGRALDAREHHVQRVGGEIVIAPGDEDLLPEEPVAVTVRHGARAHQAEIRAGLRLGEHHGAGPLAADHPLQVALLLRRRAAQLERVHRPVRQHRTQLEGETGRAPELSGRGHQRAGCGVAAEVRIRTERGPAARRELAVGIAKARGRDDTVGGPARPVQVARTVEGLEHALGEARRLFEHRARQLIGIVRELGGSGEAARAEKLLQHEAHFSYRRTIHGRSPLGRPGLV